MANIIISAQNIGRNTFFLPMPNIIVKNYEHFNTSLPSWNTPKGVYIRTKRQYDEACKRSGMISYDEAKARQEKITAQREKEKFVPSKNAIDLMKSVKDSADRKGNVKLSDRQIDAMKSLGHSAYGEKLRKQLGRVGK
jgi:hypothetical protein